MVDNGLKNTGQRCRPVFALSLGDPAGIGPEIACKAMNNKEFMAEVAVVGAIDVLEITAARLELRLPLVSVARSADFRPDQVNVCDCGIPQSEEWHTGAVQAVCGRAAYTYIDKAIAMALAGEVDGVITNPINKEALHAAGYNYPGHTEIFAEKTGTDKYSMLFLLNNIGVAHVTTHCSLREAIEQIATGRVLATIRLLSDTMIRLGITGPRIAVGGLNPHAGENGLFGKEEIEHIRPAIAMAQAEGIDASGPYPPDTVFMRAFRGAFDGVVAMLHDHGFVALKSMDFEHGVNITVGLPIIRTSVGHGTAFDIAGTGKASAESLLSAFDAARRLYRSDRGK
ncbi:MAG: 4-hydroxythreonine-4-phosphate dehydrogenase PdxA [Chitinispirillaceae bacterium]|nr:4-hydroxythreonine-4-phosphate dehydrogenase PdxA [Chitinispirillaceae bacterium]